MTKTGLLAGLLAIAGLAHGQGLPPLAGPKIAPYTLAWDNATGTVSIAATRLYYASGTAWVHHATAAWPLTTSPGISMTGAVAWVATHLGTNGSESAMSAVAWVTNGVPPCPFALRVGP